MPRPKNAVATSNASSSKAISTIDQELSQEVANLKNQVGQVAGRTIKFKANGEIEAPDGLALGNEIQVVVIDFVSRNVFYSQPFSEQNPTPPDCYAIGKDIASMKPEADSPDLQSKDGCAKCALNQFGSGNNGRSKACGNRRELAVLLIDPENPEAHNEPGAPIYQISLSPTNLKSFDAVVPAVARSLSGPPVKAILTVKCINISKTYPEIVFCDPVPNPDYAAHWARRAETVDVLYRKPDFAAYAARQPARRAPARAPQRAAAGGRR